MQNLRCSTNFFWFVYLIFKRIYSTLVPTTEKSVPSSFRRPTVCFRAMKKTDMELQAIRDKLRLLESESPAGDVLSAPWSSPKRSPFSASPLGNASQPDQLRNVQQQATQQVGASSPQAVAIETLKQRSGAANHANSRADELISQEIYRLEVQAQDINERSQQQANEILALKRSAQQAAVALRRQGICSHPQLGTIAKFLEQYPSAAVPHLERDGQGQFVLSHTTVNLHHAEQEALNTAEALRNRKSKSPFFYQEPDQADKETETTLDLRTVAQPFARVPFSQPVASGPKFNDSVEKDAAEKGAAKQRNRRSSRRGKQWTASIRSLFRRVKQNALTYSYPANSRFSLLDGAIWFSGAAIARIVLEALVLNYPILRMPLLLVLFSAISFAIYRVVVSKSTDLTSAYRLGITLLGLFIGGSF